MRAPHALLALALALAALAACDDAPARADGGLDAARDAARDAAHDGAHDAGDAGACRRGAYPPGPYDVGDTAVLENARFAEVSGAEVALERFYDPCAAPSRLLVLRVLATWSGPARWHVAHTRALRALPGGARLAVLDLLVLGQDNLPATLGDARALRALYDAPPDALAIDPTYRYSEVFYGGIQLPIVMLVDTRTMYTHWTYLAPNWEELTEAIARTLARMDGLPDPRPARPPRHDGRFPQDWWDMVRAMTPVPPPPPDPTNRYADDPRAATLGRALFDDASLSPSGRVACATCHDAARGFADGLPRGVGVAEGDRNTPSVEFAAHSRWQFWDGRADSLWMQALAPIEDAREMGSSRLFVAHAVARRHGEAYRAVFGDLPPLDDAARFPPSGRPGDPAWDAMAPADRDAVDRVFVNVGKAIAAFERTLRGGETPLDRYAAGDVDALTPAQRDGLATFFRLGCIQCHHGPLLTDQSFHNIGMPTGRLDGAADTGRRDGVARLLASPFRADGPFSDAPAAAEHLAGLAPSEPMLGQFRTPTLRETTRTGPWGHGGTFVGLDAVVSHYGRLIPRGASLPGVAGTIEPHRGGFGGGGTGRPLLLEIMAAMSAR